MLSMKTLRVAVVTMGTALLLGSGLAAATVQNLDGVGDNAPVPLMYAAETLSAEKDVAGRNNGATAPSNVMAQGRTTHYALVSPDDTANVVVVKPRRRLEDETIYVRLDLEGGMVLSGAAVQLHVGQTVFPDADNDGEPDGTADYTAGGVVDLVTPEGQTAGGSAGQSYVVFRLAVGTGATAAIALNESIWFDVNQAFAVPAGAGNYGASISAYTTADDALDGRGAVSSVAGSATIVRVVSGLDAKVTPGDTLTADVDVGFRWFTNPGGGSSMPNRAAAALGDFQAIANPMGVRSANDGATAVDADIISPEMGSVTVTVEGDLTIGAFSVVPETPAMDANTEADTPAMDAFFAACPTGPAEVDDDPENDDMGTLTNPDDAEAAVTTMGTESFGAGKFRLCVNVDTSGPMSNMNAIPVGDYTATVSVLSPGAEDPVEAASGTIGMIGRNGASVQIPYLTTSEKHNQRLVIVNRGTRPVAITEIVFTTEAGTEVELMPTVQAAMDAGLLIVPKESTYVARMDQTLMITGNSRRTAATISFAGTAGHLSVATTQVNFSDSSTDTVVYVVD